MTHKEMETTLGGYLNALGIPSDRIAHCIPLLTGDKPLPNVALAATTEASNAVVKLLTYPEAAKMLGCSRDTIRRMTKDGTLPPVNFRGKNKVRLADILGLGGKAKV